MYVYVYIYIYIYLHIYDKFEIDESFQPYHHPFRNITTTDDLVLITSTIKMLPITYYLLLL